GAHRHAVEPGQRPVEVPLVEPLDLRHEHVEVRPVDRVELGSRIDRAVRDHGEERLAEIELEVALVRELVEDPLEPELLPQLAKDEDVTEAATLEDLDVLLARSARIALAEDALDRRHESVELLDVEGVLVPEAL